MPEPRCPLCGCYLVDLPAGKGLCEDPDCKNHWLEGCVTHSWRSYEYDAGAGSYFKARLCYVCGELDYLRLEQPRPVDSQTKPLPESED